MVGDLKRIAVRCDSYGVPKVVTGTVLLTTFSVNRTVPVTGSSLDDSGDGSHCHLINKKMTARTVPTVIYAQRLLTE